MTGETLRWGVIGAGKIAHDFIQAMDKAEHKHKAVCVSASSKERAQKLVDELKLDAKAYGNYEDVINDPDVDIIYIGLHNEAHCPWIKKALEGGKRVFSEKPIGVNLREATEVFELAKQKKLFLMEATYFRRTVVLKKIYTCPRNNNCNVELDSQNRKKCKACRYAKCLKVGMDYGAVQGRRDAIGRYSVVFEREINTESTPSETTQIPIPHSIETCISQDIDSIASTSGENLRPLKELEFRYAELNRLRKTFYCQRSLTSLLDDSEELKPCELDNFKECMFDIWKVEPRVCILFVSNNGHLKNLPAGEKTRIFANFLLSFHAIEEPYLTYKFGGLSGPDKFWMMSNRVFMRFNKAEEYFDVPNLMDGLNLDKQSALNLFKPSFEHSMQTIGEKMAFMNLDDTELIGLFGIVLFDPHAKKLTRETQQILSKCRSQLFNDLYNYYQYNNVIEPQVRLGNLILLLQGVKIHAMKYRENIQLLEFFKVVPMSPLFDEIIRLTAPC